MVKVVEVVEVVEVIEVQACDSLCPVLSSLYYTTPSLPVRSSIASDFIVYID